MKRIALLTLLLSLCVVGLVNAQDEDPRENACYDGGAMEGKCGVFDNDEANEWAWNCGYYYADYLKGSIGVDEVPETCDSLLDKSVASPLSLCIKIAGDDYIWIQGFPNQSGNAALYLGESPAPRDTAPCDSRIPAKDAVIWMQTPNYVSYSTALTMCNEADTSQIWNSAFQLSDPALPNFNWFCVVSTT